MSIESLVLALRRLCLLGALLLLALALTEKTANVFGYTMLVKFSKGTSVLELAGVLLLFAIALQLRELKGEKKITP